MGAPNNQAKPPSATPVYIATAPTGTQAGGSGSGSVGTANGAAIIPANAYSGTVTIQNTHASQTLYLSFNPVVTVNDIKVSPGTAFTFPFTFSNPLYAIGSGATTTYAITGQITPALPVVLTNPAFTSPPAAGSALSISWGTFSGVPTPSTVRQILRNNVIVATGSNTSSPTYMVAANDGGAVFQATEVATNSIGSSNLAVSTPTAAGAAPVTGAQGQFNSQRVNGNAVFA